ncbi:MAG: hypothetical protein FWC26_15010 [Fibromonadales bacterium]|nr:hypothetical protein [Fibromonadales bacterium]
MKNISQFSSCILALSVLLVSCGEVGDNSNSDNLSNSSGGEIIPGNSSPAGVSSSSGSAIGSSNWKIEKAEKVSFQYDPSSGNYSLMFQNMKIEDVAIASLSSESICGFRYDFRVCLSNDRFEFFVNDKLYHREESCSTGGEHSEALPCGSYTLTWKITKLAKDGVTSITVNNIAKRPVKDTAYVQDFSFEAGWPTDLQIYGWQLGNRDKYQGSHSIHPGWLRGEESKEVRINLPDTATKLNLFYKFSDSSPGLYYKDSAYIVIGDRAWNLSTNVLWTKFSTILRSQDSVAIIKFIKREDGFSSFFIDDIRTLRYEPSAQTDGLWDFEEGFYPTEILGDWWIDNSDKYQGEYSLRAPLNTTGICGFDIDVGSADSVSFWHKCSYSGINYPKIRIGTDEDFMASNCSGSWNEYKFPTRGQQPLHIETDCVSGFERRIDHLKAW